MDHITTNVKSRQPVIERRAFEEHELSYRMVVWHQVGPTDHSQYLAQSSCSSLVPRKVKSISVMSWNPSLTLGSLKRDLNPLKAILGSATLDSGLSCK